MASLPTAECCEHNVASALDATFTKEIVEWAVMDESGMRRTEGAQESLNEATAAPSQSLRRFIELVPCSDGWHFANEVTIDPAAKDWVFYKSHGDEAGSWRSGSWHLTDTCLALTFASHFASRPGFAARTRSYFRNSYGCFATGDHTTAAHCKFLLPQSL